MSSLPTESAPVLQRPALHLPASPAPALRAAFGPRWVRWIAALAFLHALPFLCRPVLLGGDEPHYALMAHSIAVDHDLDLEDDYGRVHSGSREAGARFSGRDLTPHLAELGGRKTFTHSLGLPVLAAPGLLGLSRLAPQASPDVLLATGTLAVTFCALLAGIVLLGALLGDARAGAVVALLVYFGTPLWIYSRTFFADPYLWAFPVLAIWCLALGRSAWAGLLLGLAFVCKESALIPVLAIGGVALRLLGLRRLWPALASSGAVGVLWLARGSWLFGDPFATMPPFSAGSWRGLVGVLFDLRHGLIPFAPVLLFAVLPKRADGSRRAVALGAWASALGVIGLAGSWIDWRGGTCYGPRLLLPAIAALAVPLAFAWRSWSGNAAARWALFTAAAAGFALGLLAAWDPFRAAWSPSVLELIGGRPAASACAVLVALAGVFGLERLRRLERPAQAT